VLLEAREQKGALQFFADAAGEIAITPSIAAS
jgi:hypothetical protein